MAIVIFKNKRESCIPVFGVLKNTGLQALPAPANRQFNQHWNLDNGAFCQANHRKL
ncbi:MAG: hypothetical protein ACXWF8_05545 [Methylobacter sp.]